MFKKTPGEFLKYSLERVASTTDTNPFYTIHNLLSCQSFEVPVHLRSDLGHCHLLYSTAAKFGMPSLSFHNRLYLPASFVSVSAVYELGSISSLVSPHSAS